MEPFTNETRKDFLLEVIDKYNEKVAAYHQAPSSSSIQGRLANSRRALTVNEQQQGIVKNCSRSGTCSARDSNMMPTGAGRILDNAPSSFMLVMEEQCQGRHDPVGRKDEQQEDGGREVEDWSSIAKKRSSLINEEEKVWESMELNRRNMAVAGQKKEKSPSDSPIKKHRKRAGLEEQHDDDSNNVHHGHAAASDIVKEFSVGGELDFSKRTSTTNVPSIKKIKRTRGKNFENDEKLSSSFVPGKSKTAHKRRVEGINGRKRPAGC